VKRADVVIGLMGNLGKPTFRELLPELIHGLRKRHAKFILDQAAAEGMGLQPGEILAAERIPDLASVILSFGGDGTLLRTARTIGQRHIPILGVNIGPGLGYLTELSASELHDSLDRIVAGDLIFQERLMLESELSDDPDVAHLALNDLVVANVEPWRTLPLELMIDRTPVTTYRSDGLIISTPTGSTAYSLSAGGPILEPTLSCLIISPISPHTLSMRPVVISSERTLSITVRGGAILSADGEPVKQLQSGQTVHVKRAGFTTTLAGIKGRDFYHVLRSKLGWGAPSPAANSD
jgi:NAD+ kinase